jgi:integrase
VSAGWIKVYAPGEFRGRPGWHVRGRDQWGRPIEGRLPPAVTTERAAARVAKRLLDDANRRAPAPKQRPDPDARPIKAAPDHSFKAAALAYRRIRRPRAIDWARIEKLIACPDIGPVHVDELTTDQVAKFATDTMPHNAPDTLNREIITPYSSVLHYAYELHWRGDPIIRRFHEQEDERKAVTPADVDKLVQNANATGTYKPTSYVSSNSFATYKVAALEYLRLPNTRVADLLHLKPDDVDRERRLLHVRRGKTYDRIEWLELSRVVVDLFAALQPRAGGWLFPWRQKSGYHDWLRPLAAASGVEVSPRLYHHAESSDTLDAGLRRMIELASDADPKVVTIERTDRNAPYKVALIEYLRLRGSRISDTLALQRERDLELPGMRVRLTIGKSRDKVRWLPLSPMVTSLFANLKPCDGVYVFPWRSRSGVYKWLTPLCERLGLKVTPHQFRHALGEEAMDAEVDLLTLQAMGGWASINSARPYARASRKRLEQADRKRAEEVRTKAGREMVTEDLMGTPDQSDANVVPMRKTA